MSALYCCQSGLHDKLLPLLLLLLLLLLAPATAFPAPNTPRMTPSKCIPLRFVKGRCRNPYTEGLGPGDPGVPGGTGEGGRLEEL
jgi:hypothetical protein